MTGAERVERLRACGSEPFESAVPVRSFPSYRGQRNRPGLWWSTTVGRHAGYESWLERDHAMLLAFDPQVLGYSSQPRDGLRARRHAPDFSTRLADGSAVVIGCRPPGRIRAADAVAFEATTQGSELVGWEYRLVGESLAGTVRRLTGYRHPRPGPVARLVTRVG
ncbi:TnsA-like heteromeric transposase endonuclease subunit [Pseudonocardia acidicola]|uniref:TnsA-like heteromeric transposase endonuclease subunit n=1 Tax=Pseudonocardia acidicola TaxID=2724939 RepID=UPI00308430A7